MRTQGHLLSSAAVLAVMLASGTAVQAAEVTAERLLNAATEPQNWLMVHREYDGSRYADLNQINRDNVANLKAVFAVAIGGLQGAGTNPVGSLQGTPLVNDGMMYAPDGWGTVYKIDVSRGNIGRVAWVMDPGIDKANVWLPRNSGVALYGNSVISITGDGKVVWTNNDTGEVEKTVQVEGSETGYTITAAPLIVGDKVIVPGSGGDRGIRSHLDALNVDTGEQLWRYFSVPAAGEPGSETWKNPKSMETGGGAFWVTGSYDPEQNVYITGTGNPVPMFDPEYRPGDNLFTDSTVAIDVDNGQMKWYFQYTPNDWFDYDEEGVNLLVDVDINGETRKVVSHFGRNGFVYTLDRTNGQFIAGAQYSSHVNWTAGIDPKTGKPVEYDPNKDLQTYAIGGAQGRRAQGEVQTCPSIGGGVNYEPTSYSRSTKLIYGAGVEEGCVTILAQAQEGPQNGGFAGGRNTGRERSIGGLTAVNPATAEKVAQRLFDYPARTGVVTTSGGLAFTATSDGTVYAVNDETLEPLWWFNVGSYLQAPPMTYAVDGKQYVAIMSGGGSILRNYLAKSPEVQDMQNTSMIWVFGL